LSAITAGNDPTVGHGFDRFHVSRPRAQTARTDEAGPVLCGAEHRDELAENVSDGGRRLEDINHFLIRAAGLKARRR
jgi:hypothetical protein